MKWVGRERPKIDRIACPCLIDRFADKAPEFFYVPTDFIRTSLAATEVSEKIEHVITAYRSRWDAGRG